MKDPTAAFQLPPQMSTAAEHVDWLYTWIWWLSLAFFFAIVGAMVWFCYKYRRRRGHKAEPTGHNLPLEISWTVAPIFILVLLFHFGFKGYIDLSVSPDDAEEIQVEGGQWNWNFVYKNGIPAKNAILHVPVNRPVKLVMSSRDVLHALFIPNFRVKRDLVPGMYTSLWFTATQETGKDPEKDGIDLFCAEYCGGFTSPDGERQQGHWSMQTKVIVDNEKDFAAYMAELEKGQTPELQGEQTYKSLCSSCHTVDGSDLKGPSWKGLWGRDEILSTGEHRKVDENYVTSSIYEPNKDIAKMCGSAPCKTPSEMNPFTPDQLPKQKIDAIIAYMKTLAK